MSVAKRPRIRSAAAFSHVLLPIALLAAFAITATTQAAPVAGWHGSSSEAAATMDARWWDNQPEFSDVRAGYPECVSMRQWNREHAGLAEDDLSRIPPFSVTIHLDGSVHRERTDVAWEKAGSQAGASYWIVGGCAR